LLDLQDEKLAAEAEVKLLTTKLKTVEDHVQKAKKVCLIRRDSSSCACRDDESELTFPLLLRFRSSFESRTESSRNNERSPPPLLERTSPRLSRVTRLRSLLSTRKSLV